MPDPVQHFHILRIEPGLTANEWVNRQTEMEKFLTDATKGALKEFSVLNPQNPSGNCYVLFRKEKT